MSVDVECADGICVVPLGTLLSFSMPNRKSAFDGAALTELSLSNFKRETVQTLAELVRAMLQCEPHPAVTIELLQLMDYLGAPPGLWARVLRLTRWTPEWPRSPELAAAINWTIPAGIWEWLNLSGENLAAACEWLRAIGVRPPAPADRTALLGDALRARLVSELAGQHPEPNPGDKFERTACDIRKMRAQPADAAEVRAAARRAPLHDAMCSTLLALHWEDFTPALVLSTLEAFVRGQPMGFERNRLLFNLLEFGAVHLDEVHPLLRECGY